MHFSNMFFQKEMVLMQAAFFSMNQYFLTKSNKQKGTLWLVGVITEEIFCCLDAIAQGIMENSCSE